MKWILYTRSPSAREIVMSTGLQTTCYLNHGESFRHDATCASSHLGLRLSDRWLLASLVSLMAAAACLSVDGTLSRFFSTLQLSGDAHRVLRYAEVFGHGIGVGLILITASVLDWNGWRRFRLLVTVAFGSGLAADAVKFAIARYRPYALADSDVGASFIGLFPAFSDIPLVAASTSFPSAHAATSIGLAIGLSRYYPKGRYLFALFAILACLNRVTQQAHFPSDVFFAAALAFAFCRWVIGRDEAVTIGGSSR